MAPELGSRFFKNFENVGALVGSLGRPGGPGKLWGQSLLNKDLAEAPQRGRESTDPVPKRADFSDTRATKKKSENVGPLVGSLARPSGPGKLWGQPLLNKDLAQTPQSQNSRGGALRGYHFRRRPAHPDKPGTWISKLQARREGEEGGYQISDLEKTLTRQ